MSVVTTAGIDYEASAGVVSFPPGVTSRSVTVRLLGDKILEPDETFVVNLSGASAPATLVDSQGVGTLTNDDVAGFSVNDVTVVETASGTAIATFTVTLAPASGVATSVSYATANGTATAPADYVAKSGTLTFPAGTTAQTVGIVVNADGVREAVETFAVNLAAPTGGVAIADPQGAGRIYDAGAFFTVAPCRVVDTRNATGARGGPALAGNGVRTFTIAGACGVPTGVRALALNVTVTGATAAGDLRYSAGVAVPLASAINYSANRTRATNLTVNTNESGQVNIRCDQVPGSNVQVILDVAGYYR